MNWHGKAPGSNTGRSAEEERSREDVVIAGVGLPFLSFQRLFRGDDSNQKSVSAEEPKVKVEVLEVD